MNIFLRQDIFGLLHFAIEKTESSYARHRQAWDSNSKNLPSLKSLWSIKVKVLRRIMYLLYCCVGSISFKCS